MAERLSGCAGQTFRKALPERLFCGEFILGTGIASRFATKEFFHGDWPVGWNISGESDTPSAAFLGEEHQGGHVVVPGITASFSCGQPQLDEYIRRYASQVVRRNVARVFWATPEAAPNTLAGFFTLSAGSVSCLDLPELMAKKLPCYPVPVTLIGRRR